MSTIGVSLYNLSGQRVTGRASRAAARCLIPILALLLTILLSAGCGGNSLDPDPVDPGTPGGGGGGVNVGEADLRVLFIGNSLTSENNLPEMVQTIAEAAGHSFAHGSVVALDSSLEPSTGGLPVVDFGEDAGIIYQAVEDAVAAANR